MGLGKCQVLCHTYFRHVTLLTPFVWGEVTPIGAVSTATTGVKMESNGQEAGGQVVSWGLTRLAVKSMKQPAVVAVQCAGAKMGVANDGSSTQISSGQAVKQHF